jgi:hypothetical protein
MRGEAGRGLGSWRDDGKPVAVHAKAIWFAWPSSPSSYLSWWLCSSSLPSTLTGLAPHSPLSLAGPVTLWAWLESRSPLPPPSPPCMSTAPSTPRSSPAWAWEPLLETGLRARSPSLSCPRWWVQGRGKGREACMHACSKTRRRTLGGGGAEAKQEGERARAGTERWHACMLARALSMLLIPLLCSAPLRSPPTIPWSVWPPPPRPSPLSSPLPASTTSTTSTV